MKKMEVHWMLRH